MQQVCEVTFIVGKIRLTYLFDSLESAELQIEIVKSMLTKQGIEEVKWEKKIRTVYTSKSVLDVLREWNNTKPHNN